VLLRTLLLFLLFVFLARAAWRLIEGVARGAMGNDAPGPRRPGGPPSAVKMAKCPVCGTYVVPGKALTGVAGGQVVYFCSEACRSTHAA
jgi:YHS domain-containing protein